MAKYGINPFTGEIYVASEQTTASGNKEPIIIPHDELSHEWIINSPVSYPEPIIYATQIGDKVLEKAIVVDTFWEHLNSVTIRILFGNTPVIGFVILN